MENFFYKIKLLILRIFGYEKPLRVALLKYLSLKFTTFRPHYETLIYETSKNAIKLGYNEINIIELGVAGGDGIRSLVKYKKKIGLIIFDLDLYSSTKLFLNKIPEFSKENMLLPRTFCYFDDLFLADYCLDDTNGEPLAISEFNINFKEFKLGKSFDHINDFKFPLAKGQIYTLHDLNNVDYEKYIGIYDSESLSGKKKDKFRSLLDD